MNSNTSTMIEMPSEGATALVPPSSGGAQFSVQMTGGGSSPGLIGLPAETGLEGKANSSTQSTAGSKILLKFDSPVVEVIVDRSGLTARASHSTTEDPADLILYRSLIARADLPGAALLCRERLLRAPEGRPAARWTKDLAIVRTILGQYESAFELLASRYRTAREIGGAFAGRYEVTLAYTFQQRGIYDPAFEHLTAAYILGEGDNDPLLCANTDVSTGRCYTAAGRPDSSFFYFDRALEVAQRANDSHLAGEIHESIALALEAEGRYAEAEASAWLSVQMLTQTGDKTATAESIETWQRVRAKR